MLCCVQHIVVERGRQNIFHWKATHNKTPLWIYLPKQIMYYYYIDYGWKYIYYSDTHTLSVHAYIGIYIYSVSAHETWYQVRRRWKKPEEDTHVSEAGSPPLNCSVYILCTVFVCRACVCAYVGILWVCIRADGS